MKVRETIDNVESFSKVVLDIYCGGLVVTVGGMSHHGQVVSKADGNTEVYNCGGVKQWIIDYVYIHNNHA